MNQYVEKDIPFSEIGADEEVVRTNEVAVIPKPPPPPSLSSLLRVGNSAKFYGTK